MWIDPRDYKLIGNYLALLRRECGVSQDQLAAILQKPQSFISSYERGQRRVDFLEFICIAAALKVDAAAHATKLIEFALARTASRKSDAL